VIKDIITAILIFIFLTLSRSVELVGFDTQEAQRFAYDMGISLAILAFMIWAVTEVKGDRVYLWLFGLVTASMNPINLIFLDLKLTMVHALICYVLSAWLVFLYRKYRVNLNQ